MPILDRAYDEVDGFDGWPPYLYKYRSLRNPSDLARAKSIIDGSIFAAHRKDFNDPYDCAPVLEYRATRAEMDAYMKGIIWKHTEGVPRTERRRKLHVARHRIKHQGGKTLASKSVEDTLDAVGIVSLTAKCDDLLMWGHYGSEHTGVCFRFNLKEPSSDFRAAFPVGYRDERPVLRYPIGPGDELIDTAFLSKARCWQYEEEWRVIHRDGAGAKAFRPQSLDGMIFGARTSNAHLDELMGHAQHRVRQPIEFFRTALDKRTYTLEIRPVAVSA